jgi:hypothetical protein
LLFTSSKYFSSLSSSIHQNSHSSTSNIAGKKHIFCHSISFTIGVVIKQISLSLSFSFDKTSNAFFPSSKTKVFHNQS